MPFSSAELSQAVVQREGWPNLSLPPGGISLHVIFVERFG